MLTCFCVRVCSWVTGSRGTGPHPSTSGIIQTADLYAGKEPTTCLWRRRPAASLLSCLREPRPSATCPTRPWSRATRGCSRSSTGRLVSLSGRTSFLKPASTMSVGNRLTEAHRGFSSSDPSPEEEERGADRRRGDIGVAFISWTTTLNESCSFIFFQPKHHKLLWQHLS